MPYCSKCGVEVGYDVDTCPLCKTPIQKLNAIQGNKKKKYPDEPVPEPVEFRIPVKKIRLLAWEILSVILTSAILIVIFVDLTYNRGITWSKYPFISLLLVWLLSTFPLILYKKPLFIVICEVSTSIIFLFLIDFFDNGKIDWFYKMAIPIIILLVVVTSIVVFASLRSKTKGSNIAGFILLGIGAISTGLDLIINWAVNGNITLNWSIFVIIPSILTGLFLIYYHYRLSKIINLKKWFQL
jgi:hypothetical protein